MEMKSELIFLTCCTGFDGYVLGVYEDEQRATEVLKQIFNGTTEDKESLICQKNNGR